MVNSIYSDMRDVASELFAEFKQGEIVYVELQSAAGATPDDPGEPVTVSHVLNATARPVSTKYVDGSNIVQSDKQVSMPNDGVTPSLSGSLRIDGSTYKIIQVMPIPAAGDPVSFTLIVRR